MIAVDGTRLKAVNSRDRNFTGAKPRRDLAASQERLERHLQQMDEMDAADMADARPSKGRRRDPAQKITALRERQARLETHRKALQESGEDQLSLTDPDARAMHSGTGVGVGYNVQIAVDTKHKLIAEHGFEDAPAVARWLELVKTDPLPEVRYAKGPTSVRQREDVATVSNELDSQTE